MIRRVAAVDCGTNSLRLLLADVDPGRAELADVIRRMEIVRLGQGVDQTGRLAPEALARTMAVLREYADVIARSGAQAVRMVATSATRDADNAAEFVRQVKEVLGVAPEVLTGGEEAVLSFTGATAELAAAGMNPFGREALEAVGAWWLPGPCVDEHCVDEPCGDKDSVPGDGS